MRRPGVSHEMSEQFRADTDRLRSTAPAFEQLGAEVEALVQQLRDIVTSDIAPWGADDTGRAFAESFEPEEKQTLSELDGLTEVIRQTGPDLRQVAANFEQQDQLGRRVVENAEPVLAERAAVPVGADPVVPGHDSGLLPPADSGGAPVYPARNGPVPVGPAGEVSDPAAATTATPGVTPSGAGAAPQDGQQRPSQQSRQPEADSAADSPEHGRSATDHPLTSAGLPAALPAPGSPGGPVSASSNPAPSPAARDMPGHADRAAASAGSPATPWSRPAAGAGAPRVTAPGTGSAEAPPPRMPAQPPRRPNDKPEEPERPVDAVNETLAARLTRELAEQYGVRAFGFDTPALGRGVLLELAAAVHDVLPRHPAIALRAIGIDEIDGGCVTRLDREPIADESDSAARPDPDTGQERFGVRITLATAVAVEPDQLQHAVRADEDAGLLAPGCAQRPVYSSIVRELGRALDAAGGFRARPASRRALLAAYLPLASPQATSTLGRTVTGFVQWRAELSGGFRDGRFEPAAALAEAFTEVVLDAGRASPPARVLHRLLVESAGAGRARGNG